MARTKNTKQGKAKKVQEDQPQVEEIQKKRIRKGQVSIQEVFIVIDEVIKVNLIIFIRLNITLNGKDLQRVRAHGNLLRNSLVRI